MRKSVFEFLMVMLISLLFLISAGFYIFNYSPKSQELKAIEEGPGGIIELTMQRDMYKAYIANIDNYKKELDKAKEELSELMKEKKISPSKKSF
ncbi:MAG TPA: hypothetical protein PL110_10390 [Candidatus Eremiobacteraeota bacterium]|nr:hypothetical protein [Candidatus Eremiobacteraeota bacterium]